MLLLSTDYVYRRNESSDVSLFDWTSLRTGIMAGIALSDELMRAVTEKMHITHITSVYGFDREFAGNDAFCAE